MISDSVLQKGFAEELRTAWRGDGGGYKLLTWLVVGMHGRLVDCFSYSYFSIGYIGRGLSCSYHAVFRFGDCHDEVFSSVFLSCSLSMFGRVISSAMGVVGRC